MFTFFIQTSLILRIAYSVFLYLFIGYSLYHIAKRQHLSCSWIAYLPFFQFYIIGILCEDYRISNYRISHLQWVMVGFTLLQTILPFLGGLSFFLVRICINLLMGLFYHKFFYLYLPQNAALLAFLSFIDRLPFALILYFVKDKPMVMSAGAFPHPFAS